MGKFTRKNIDDILKNQIESKTLIDQYPKITEAVVEELSIFNKESNSKEIVAVIDKYKAKARYAIDKIRNSGESSKVVDTFLPDIIKARIAIYILQQSYLSAQSSNTGSKIKFNLWDGLILQRILFKKNFERKPASMFWYKFFWTFITNKKILMPLVNQKGIYCFYSETLIKELTNLIGNSKCLEIGAGDGTLTRFLKEKGVECHATDDYSWEYYVKFPEFVERLDAKEALQKYKPDTVICSWPPSGNTFEKNVFNKPSVKLYIVIGSKNPLISGAHDSYETQEDFNMELSERLSSLILPISKDNAVYIFRRK